MPIAVKMNLSSISIDFDEFKFDINQSQAKGSKVSIDLKWIPTRMQLSLKGIQMRFQPVQLDFNSISIWNGC